MSKNTTDGFGVIHFHTIEEDINFTSGIQNDFYIMAYAYANRVRGKESEYTVDTLAEFFGDYSPIAEDVFGVLSESIKNDDRVSAVADFDFENNKLCICERHDKTWHVYDLDDVAQGIKYSNKIPNMPLKNQRDLFEDYMSNKETVMTENQTLSMEM